MTAGQQTRIDRRFETREEPQQTPRPVEGEPGLFVVDATWGSISPIRLHPEVETVAEPEVIDHLEAGGLAVDTRSAESFAAGTLPGADNVPHGGIADRIGDLAGDGEDPIVVFCNGPQCPATPHAVESLLAAGFAPRRIHYYRGGIHDWVTLGLPLVRPRA